MSQTNNQSQNNSNQAARNAAAQQIRQSTSMNLQGLLVRKTQASELRPMIKRAEENRTDKKP